MRNFLAILAAATTVTALGACDRSDQSAETEVAIEPESHSDTMSGTMANGMDREMMAMSGPFADVERGMHSSMMGAVGSNVDQTWVKKMIAHHQGAIDMAKVYLAHADADDSEAKSLARTTIDKQTKEIAELRKLETGGAADATAAKLYAESEMAMMRAMMNAKRDDIDESFLAKMLAHHEGGVALSDVLARNGNDTAIKAMGAQTAAKQREEADKIRTML